MAEGGPSAPPSAIFLLSSRSVGGQRRKLPMPEFPVVSLLLIMVWGLLAVLIALTALIAQFYQRLSGRRTFARLFALPIILFGVAAIRAASANRLIGDPLADSAAIGGAVILMALAAYLYRIMTMRG